MIISDVYKFIKHDVSRFRVSCSFVLLCGSLCRSFVGRRRRTAVIVQHLNIFMNVSLADVLVVFTFLLSLRCLSLYLKRRSCRAYTCRRGRSQVRPGGIGTECGRRMSRSKLCSRRALSLSLGGFLCVRCSCCGRTDFFVPPVPRPRLHSTGFSTECRFFAPAGRGMAKTGHRRRAGMSSAAARCLPKERRAANSDIRTRIRRTRMTANHFSTSSVAGEIPRRGKKDARPGIPPAEGKV